jgi:hypothetical protein
VAKTAAATVITVAALETVNNSVQSNNYRAVVQSENQRRQQNLDAAMTRMLMDRKCR